MPFFCLIIYYQIERPHSPKRDSFFLEIEILFPLLLNGMSFAYQNEQKRRKTVNQYINHQTKRNGA
jgi:hypothetical protein